MKNFLLILVLVFCLQFNTSFAAYNQASESLISLFNTKSVKMDNELKITLPKAYSGFGNLFGSSTKPKTKSLTAIFKFNTSQDITNPGFVKAKQQLQFSNFAIFGLPFDNAYFESRILGENLYLNFKDPFFSKLIKNKKITDWLNINPRNIKELNSVKYFSSKDVSEIESIYKDFLKFNKEPVKFLKNNQDYILKYTELFDFVKYKSKIVDNKNVDVYQFTLNKSRLKDLLIKEINASSINQEYRDYQIKSIDQNLASFELTEGYFSYFTDSKKPYGINMKIKYFGNSTKELLATLELRTYFSEYEKPLSLTKPKAISIANFYNKYLKPVLEEARQKGSNASIKSSLSSVRAKAEIAYDSNNGSYSPIPYSGYCSKAIQGSLFYAPQANIPDISVGSDIKQAESVSGEKALCYGTSTSYAVSIKLLNNEGYFCVDSTGVAKNIVRHITSPSCDSSN